MSERTIAILDISHVLHRTWHAENDKDRAHFVAQDKVNQLATNGKWDDMEIALDTPPYKRNAIYPEYKGNRKKVDPGFPDYARKVLDYVTHKYVCWRSAGYEADDVIATWCKLNSSERKVVISSDKDLMQLVEKGQTVFFNLRGNEFVGADQVEDKFGVHPMYIRDYLALVGDASDNIKGCPGIGPKAAEKLITQYGTIDRMFKNETSFDEKLERGREEIFLALQLVTLEDSIPLERLKTEATESNGMTMEQDMSIEEEKTEAPKQEVEVEAPTERPQNLGHTKSHILSATDIEGIQSAVRLICKAPMYAKKADPLTLLSIAIQGAEMGFSPITFLQRSHVMHGTLCMSAHDIIGLAKSHPNTEYFECSETTPESCTYVYKARGGKERSFTYDLDTARADKLSWVSKEKNRLAMIRKTAGCQAARLFCPESLHGLYGTEEF